MSAAAGELLEVIAEKGPGRIGEQATSHLLMAIDLTARVNRALLRQITTPSPEEIDERSAKELLDDLLMYALASSAAMRFVISSKRRRGRANAEALAHAAYVYALRTYEQAKSLKLMTIMAPPGEPIESAPEDLALVRAAALSVQGD
jgi:hypothetical protein